MCVLQGDLTDPLYFDFISFAQFATLNEEMRYGKQTFQVLLLASGEKALCQVAMHASTVPQTFH